MFFVRLCSVNATINFFKDMILFQLQLLTGVVCKKMYQELFYEDIKCLGRGLTIVNDLNCLNTLGTHE